MYIYLHMLHIIYSHMWFIFCCVAFWLKVQMWLLHDTSCRNYMGPPQSYIALLLLFLLLSWLSLGLRVSKEHNIYISRHVQANHVLATINYIT